MLYLTVLFNLPALFILQATSGFLKLLSCKILRHHSSDITPFPLNILSPFHLLTLFLIYQDPQVFHLQISSLLNLSSFSVWIHTQGCSSHLYAYCTLPVSSVHWILHARILGWIAHLFSKGSSWPRNQIQVSCIASRFFLLSEPAGKHLIVAKI